MSSTLSQKQQSHNSISNGKNTEGKHQEGNNIEGMSASLDQKDRKHRVIDVVPIQHFLIKKSVSLHASCAGPRKRTDVFVQAQIKLNEEVPRAVQSLTQARKMKSSVDVHGQNHSFFKVSHLFADFVSKFWVSIRRNEFVHAKLNIKMKNIWGTISETTNITEEGWFEFESCPFAFPSPVTFEAIAIEVTHTSKLAPAGVILLVEHYFLPDDIREQLLMYVYLISAKIELQTGPEAENYIKQISFQFHQIHSSIDKTLGDLLGFLNTQDHKLQGHVLAAQQEIKQEIQNLNLLITNTCHQTNTKNYLFDFHKILHKLKFLPTPPELLKQSGPECGPIVALATIKLENKAHGFTTEFEQSGQQISPNCYEFNLLLPGDILLKYTLPTSTKILKSVLVFGSNEVDMTGKSFVIPLICVQYSPMKLILTFDEPMEDPKITFQTAYIPETYRCFLIACNLKLNYGFVSKGRVKCDLD